MNANQEPQKKLLASIRVHSRLIEGKMLSDPDFKPLEFEGFGKSDPELDA